MSNARRPCLALVLALLLPLAASAEKGSKKLSLWDVAPELTPVSDYTTGDLWNRNTMFGDVDQRRQKLYEHGFAIDIELTQVPQGVVSGGADENWEYSGLANYQMAIDTGRLGWWPGGMAAVSAVSRFGTRIFSDAGNIVPVNYNFLLPDLGPNADTFLEEYYVTQGLTDWLVVTGGRMLTVNLADQNRFAGSPTTQFLNAALGNNPVLLYFTPLSAHLGAVIVQPNEHFSIAGVAISANDQDGIYGSPGGLFSEVTTGGEIDISWKLGNLPGTARPIGLYTTRNPVALDNPFIFLQALLPRRTPTTKDDNWAVGINLDQYLYMPGNGDRGAATGTRDFDFNPEGVGVFFRYAYTPDDRNLFNDFVSGGVGGRGLVPGRPNDRWGVGFWGLFVSEELANIPGLRRLETEWGMEAYYNIAITPWLQFTPDVQYIQSGLARFPGIDDDVVVLSFRINIVI